MAFVIHNGNLVRAEEPYLDATNRAFKFGDGLFETIRIIDGKPFNLKNHFSRLSEGAKLIRLKLPVGFTLEKLEETISELLVNNNIDKGGKVRLSMYRGGAGTYMPMTSFADYVLEAFPMDKNKFGLNEVGLTIDIFDEMKKPMNKLSVFKTSNALLYIIAAEFARENGLSDALIINEKLSIIEATSANLFIVSNGVLYTPSLEDGCVGGTMRMRIINLALDNGIKVYECSLSPHNLLAADEIFLTNSIEGIKWVVSYKTKRYFNDTSHKLLHLLNDSIA